MGEKRKGKERSPSEILIGAFFIAVLISVGILLMLLSPRSFAQQLPPSAHLYLPTLVAEYKQYWPDHPMPAFLPAQVEQETCPSLTSKKCWNPRTENINPKNNGEYGWGLGQLTNTNRYNNFKDVTAKYDGLKSWKWEDRFDPAYQIRTMLYMVKNSYKGFTGKTVLDKYKFALSAYNGGGGSVLNDKKYCAQFPDCDSSVWDDNVETHSVKAKTKLSGYSISAYTINRDYVERITVDRYPKYVPYLQEAALLPESPQVH